MKKMVLLLVAVILTACGQKLTEGDVFEKEFHPAHTSVQPQTVVHSDGKSTTTSIIMVSHYYPDSWSIGIQAYDAEAKKWIRDTYWVSKEAFDTVEIGNYWKATTESLDTQPRMTRRVK